MLAILRWCLPVCLAVLCCFAVSAAGPTPVGGTINASQTWTPAGNPYVVTKDVVVKPGVTLTIMPGTVVQFAYINYPKPYTRRAVLRVMGHLKAVGTADAPVKFTLLEGVAMGDWGGIWIDGYSGGTAELSYVHVERAVRGVYASGAAVVVENSVFDLNLTGLHLEGGSGHVVRRNSFSRNEYGIYADQASGTVEENLVASNSFGIYNFLDRGLDIQHNDIKSNTFGIVHDGGSSSVISYNDFSIRQPNDYAVLVRGGSPSVITQNNFLFDDAIVADPYAVFWYIYNESDRDIAAPNNWWDTTDKAVVEAYTYDRRDSAARGLIGYEPMASERVPGTVDDLQPLHVELLSITPCSPNGDGALDSCVIPYSLSESALEVTVSVVDVDGHMGAPGAVIRRYQYSASGEGRDFTLDGTHAVYWNGRAQDGTPAPEGRYEARVTAVDTAGFGAGAAAAFVVDLTPPELQVTTPTPGTVAHFAELPVQGTVRDMSDVSVRVGGNLAPVVSGTDYLWSFAGQAVLTADDSDVDVVAVDAAGNRSVIALDVVSVPWLTIHTGGITNLSSEVVTGEILHSSIQSVDITVTAPSGETTIIGASIDLVEPYPVYTGQQPVPLEVGRNLIVVSGYDAGNNKVTSVAAWLEYDPYYDREVEHTFNSGISMITVPVVLQSGDQGAALSLSGDWDLARWQETAEGSGYVRYSEAPIQLDPFAPGRGYWLRLGEGYAAGHKVTLRGNLADATRPYPVPLSPGWNLIGNPFLTAVIWNKVQVQVEGSNPVSWETAVNQGWLRPWLWGYSGSGYTMSSSMMPWQGYWVKTSRELTLLVPPPGGQAVAQAAGATGGVASAYQQAAALPAPGEWRLNIVARAGQASDADNYLGVARQATDGCDLQYDWEEPPAALAGVSFSFTGSAPVPLAADIRGPLPGAPLGRSAAAARVWQAQVTASGSETVSLMWPTASLLPAGVQVVLVDEQTGARVDLRQAREYTYQPQAAGEVRSFRFEVQEAQLATIADVRVYPNPWSGSGTVTVRVDVTGPGRVRVGIYDAVGRLLQRLEETAAGPGRVELAWNGRTARGATVPSGLYLVRVTVEGPGGATPAVSERLVVWR